MTQGWYYVESGGNDMIESKLKAKNCNCGQLFGPCWASSARCSKLYGRLISIYSGHILNKCRWWWPQMKLKANWPMSHAKRMTRDNRKNPECHVVSAIRKLMRTDTNCPAGKSCPNHVKKEQHIGSEKTYCTCIGAFNCLSTLIDANKIAELFLTTCSHLLFKTYFKPDEFIFF